MKKRTPETTCEIGCVDGKYNVNGKGLYNTKSMAMLIAALNGYRYVYGDGAPPHARKMPCAIPDYIRARARVMLDKKEAREDDGYSR